MMEPTAAATRARRRNSRGRNQSCVFVTTTRCLLLYLVAACCSPRLGEAFLSSVQVRRPPAFSSRRACARVTVAPVVVMAAKGFGKGVPPPAAVGGGKGGADAGSGGVGGGRGAAVEEGVDSWEKEYKAYIKRTGQYLCSMSWDGHEEMGRGAIFANYDDARAGGKLNEADKFGGIPSMYVPLTEFESMRAAGKPGEEDDLAQILQRVKAYNPEKEFVVVFQAAGTMGADIVRPNVSPPEMAKHVVQSDGMSTMPSASGLDGVIDVN